MASWDRKIWERIRDYFISTQSAIRVKGVNTTQFSEDLVAERTPVIELNSSYGTSLIRDNITTTNGGTIEPAEGVLRLSVTGDPDSRSLLESSEIGRYVPGYGAQIGVGIRCNCTPEGDSEVRWGGWDAEQENGFYFGVDSLGKFVAIKRANTVSKVYQQDWNIDKLDGSGQSRLDLNPELGFIYQIEFSWYGYGQILFGVTGVDESTNQQRFIPCHSLRRFDETSVLTPNLRIFVDVVNSGDGNTYQVDVGGRQYSIVGKYEPIVRVNGDWRDTTSVGTTTQPLISLRQKEDFLSRSIKARGFDIVDVTESIIAEIRVGGDLTDGSWENLSNQIPEETSLEVNKSATEVIGGTIIWTGIIGAEGPGSNRESASIDTDVDVPEGKVITLCARAFTGTSSTRSAFRVTEEW